MTAAEIVQCYVRFPGTIKPRAGKSLKAFARAELAPGALRIVRMVIAIDDLRYRDPVSHSWRLEPGLHHIIVGGSSAGDQLTSELYL